MTEVARLSQIVTTTTADDLPTRGSQMPKLMTMKEKIFSSWKMVELEDT